MNTSLPLHRLILVAGILSAGLLLALPGFRFATAIEEYRAAHALHASVAGRVQAACLSGVSDGGQLTALLEQRWNGDVTVRHDSVPSTGGRCVAHDFQLVVRTDAAGLERMLDDLARAGALRLRELQCESRQAGYIDCAIELEARLEAVP